MPCDSIAFLKAKVDLDLPENLAKMLDVESVAAVILAQFQNLKMVAGVNRKSDSMVEIRVMGNTTFPRGLMVTYQDGRVEVNTESTRWDSAAAQAQAQAIAQEIQNILRQAASLLLQKKVMDTLAQVATIESATDYGSAIVYRVSA